MTTSGGEESAVPPPKTQTALASLSASLLSAHQSISSRFASRPLPVIDELESAGTPPSVEASKTETKKSQPSLLSAARLLLDTLSLEESEKSKIFRLFVVLSLATVGRSLSEFLLVRSVARFDAFITTPRRPQFFFGVFFPSAVAASLLAVLSSHLQHRLSSELRFSLLKSIIANLVLSEANISQPTPLIDAERLDLVMTDAASLATNLSNVYVERLKKISDLALHLGLFAAKRNFRAPLAMAAYLLVAQRILGRAKPEKISDSENLKKSAIRLLRHREAVKLWGGRDTEISNFGKLVDSANSAKSAREISDSKFALYSSLAHKVGATGLGMFLVARPFFDRKSQLEISDFLWTSRAMYSLSTSLLGLFDDFNIESGGSASRLHSLAQKLKHALVDFPASESRKKSEISDRFKVHDQSITLCDVTFAHPDGSGVLFKDLSLEIFPGKTLLVSGPRGSGKSSLAKIISGMWTPTLGQVCRPQTGVLVLPQRPYVLSEATLKEQVIYPGNVQDIDANLLLEALQVAKIENLFPGNAHFGGTTSLTSEADQTRLMLARLLYHAPRFALIDGVVSEIESLLAVVAHLRNRGSAVVVFAASSAAETLRTRFQFDAELKLNVNPAKQPPKHELLFPPSSTNTQ